MKIYSQGDQAIVVSIEKNVSQRLTEDLLSLRAYLIHKSLSLIHISEPTRLSLVSRMPSSA